MTISRRKMDVEMNSGTASNNDANSSTEPQYVPPFSFFGRALKLTPEDLNTNKNVEIPVELFKFFIATIVSQGFFDERWYLETNPDVQRAIDEHEIDSGLEHYLSTGYYEGRQPGRFPVDVNWYIEYYPDLKQALEDKTILDPVDHFSHSGYFEGRVSCAEHLPSVQRWLSILGRAKN
jgi:hypothetical protein